MGWTQPDHLYGSVPDRAKSTPRRANLFQFSLNNPTRYVDPDGREPTDYNVLYDTAIFNARKSNLDSPVKAGLDALSAALGIDVGSAKVNVVEDIAAFLPPGTQMYPGTVAFTEPGGKNIYLDRSSMEISRGLDAASILVHEGEHAKRGAKAADTRTEYQVSEFYAIRAERDFWLQKLKERKINPEQYRDIMDSRVNRVAELEGVKDWFDAYGIEEIVARYESGMHWNQAWLPEYYVHVSLSNDVYRQKGCGSDPEHARRTP